LGGFERVIYVDPTAMRSYGANLRLLSFIDLIEKGRKIHGESPETYEKELKKGSASELKENPDIKEFYLGLAASGSQKSFRDVKSYKRRKRWL